jgi:dUTPase
MLDKDLPVFHFSLDEKLSELCEKHNKLHSNESPLDAQMFLPTKTNLSSVGWDVRCAEPSGVLISPGQYKSVNLGFNVFCPNDWALRIIPCPDLFVKKHLHSLHRTIEQSELDNLKLVIQYVPDSKFLIKNSLSLSFGEKIAKVIPFKIQNMEVKSVSKYELQRMNLFKS